MSSVSADRSAPRVGTALLLGARFAATRGAGLRASASGAGVGASAGSAAAAELLVLAGGFGWPVAAPVAVFAVPGVAILLSDRGLAVAVFAGVLRAEALAAFAGAFGIGSGGGACCLPVESEDVDEVSWDTERFLAIYQCAFLSAKTVSVPRGRLVRGRLVRGPRVCGSLRRGRLRTRMTTLPDKPPNGPADCRPTDQRTADQRTGGLADPADCGLAD